MDIYNPDFVRGHFNRMSRSYEIMNLVTSFGFTIWWRKQYLGNLSKSSEKLKVLDLLTGMGESWSFIKSRFPNCELSGLDFSEEMIKYAQLKNHNHFNSNIELINDNVLENKLEANCYDIIVSSFGLKTFDDKQLEQLAFQVDRMLKLNGKFSFIEVSIPSSNILLWFYKLYIKYVIAGIGGFFFSNNDEYKLLWEYTINFVNAKKALPFFESTGLKVEYKEYFFGCASGLYGEKIK